jgi:hypothetical protein
MMSLRIRLPILDVRATYLHQYNPAFHHVPLFLVKPISYEGLYIRAY